jgi:hypothetical protein
VGERFDGERIHICNHTNENTRLLVGEERVSMIVYITVSSIVDQHIHTADRDIEVFTTTADDVLPPISVCCHHSTQDVNANNQTDSKHLFLLPSF